MATPRRPWLRTVFARKSANLTDEEQDRRIGGLEILIASLLGLAAVATAFAAYQAELKNGESIEAFNQGIRAVDEASQALTEGNQQLAQDQQVFLEFAKAANANQDELLAYIRTELASDELKKGLEWWEKQPEKTQPATPFVDENPDYQLEAFGRGEELDKKADQEFKRAKSEDEKGDRFTLITVILAVALFLYGIAGVTRRLPIKLGAMVAGLLIFVISLALLATS